MKRITLEQIFKRVMGEQACCDLMGRGACENRDDDGVACGVKGRYYPTCQAYLCDDCADGYCVNAS